MDTATAKAWQAPEVQTGPFLPATPHSLEEAGLSSSLVEQLLLKNLYFRPEATGRELAQALGLRFSVIEPIVLLLKKVRHIEIKRSSSIGTVSASFALSEAGRARAKEYLETNQLVGPAPVPLDQYIRAVQTQRVKPGWMKKQNLKRAFKDAVVDEDYFRMIGPAVNSFRSMLVYGKPGNGKTFLSQQLAKVDAGPVFVPYVVEAEGQLIKVFDSMHRVVQCKMILNGGSVSNTR